MQQFKLSAAVLSLAVLAGCGGGSTGSPSKPQFSAVISFGDSLSDAGSYAPATINPATGLPTGGKFTTNPGPIWIEDIAAKLNLTITPNVVGYATTSVTCPKTSCTAYGQGGSRVTSINGIGHDTGALTIPMKTQMDNHLAANASYKPTDLVFVYGGNNDVFYQAGYVAAVIGNASAAPGATAASVGAAAQAAQQTAGLAMATAATELAGYVRDKILAKGAKYVVVMNLPDSAATPYGASTTADGRALLTGLVNTFNATFQKAVTDLALDVVVVDANAANKDVFTNSVQYGVTNFTVPACDLTKLPGGSSLFCNASTLIPSANAGFLFADSVHPTIFGHRLFADYVTLQLAKKGWF
ncbi:Phospholipase/lecithinase/hemolysin [Oxalobacteraceae bacterium IMCC9480]|nr:Phospholipase/lecithinase/hemolysin [Oxalobacteraceae bacterium IMCC9480]NDP57910.1 GDSL family lipase [Oxalobacteraceae bacterium]